MPERDEEYQFEVSNQPRSGARGDYLVRFWKPAWLEEGGGGSDYLVRLTVPEVKNLSLACQKFLVEHANA